ncbi:MAG TPA: SpoIVB peptidase [Clostridiaceae bacterium]|jgi:SpoIVB peptidase|nr:SpoIVB peptidase [Clostridiaceae bacterium]
MNKLKQFFCIAILIVIYVYVCNITLLPNSVIIFEGEELNLKTVVGLKIKRANGTNMPVIQASNLGESEQSSKYETAGTFELNLNLFGTIPVKEIDVNVIPKTKVVPMGNLIGAKLYTSGVLVVGMSEIQGDDQQKHKPYEGSGIEEGDMIVEMDSKKIANTDELVETVNSSKGKVIQIKYVRNDETITTSIQPIKSEDNEYKLGLWVRDAAAGVGTLTFYEPSTGKFAALGHGIVDVDTGDIINIANGELVTSNLVAIKKGEKGTPGEIKGSIDSGVTIGNISKNTNFGVFGLVSNKNNLNLNGAKEYEVALRSEIQTGEAEIICELENGKKEKYKIEISKIYTSNNYDNKSMMIKITDERLLQKTGGIIQGMSGSPIIQNGKFVGAITNVLVSDPTTGYAIFGDLMVKQMKSVK